MIKADDGSSAFINTRRGFPHPAYRVHSAKRDSPRFAGLARKSRENVP
jgi:hypothetical protein